jgi:hypothetical protein
LNERFDGGAGFKGAGFEEVVEDVGFTEEFLEGDHGRDGVVVGDCERYAKSQGSARRTQLKRERAQGWHNGRGDGGEGDDAVDAGD